MPSKESWPRIIQGGMGIGVSNYRLARAASRAGAIGVVSGTAIDTVLMRRLQLGDETGDVRRALAQFPDAGVAERILLDYFIPGGKKPGEPFRLLALPNATMSRARLDLIVAANFVEVFLAKEGHGGLIGVNYLEKLQVPTLPSLFGAILAGVDVVLMGAGIPLSIPGALDRLARFETAEIRFNVEQSEPGQSTSLRFAPSEHLTLTSLATMRPRFFAIVSSHIIAKTLTRKANGKVDGFVIEDYTAGGHNAPPRKSRTASAFDKPAFGSADIPNLAEFRELGLPFWIAGSCASPAKLEAALAQGAEGVQLGTAFAFCDESGITSELKRDVIARARTRRLAVVTDFEASPTGYPFKRVERDGLDHELDALRGRTRICDLGYLRRPYADKGAIGYRCPGEPVATYMKKGGFETDAVNKLCLCNQLFATVGLGQTRETGDELPLLTAGEELAEITAFIDPSAGSFSAERVIRIMTGELPPARAHCAHWERDERQGVQEPSGLSKQW
jgi:nitronate monooxygenase